MATITSLGVGSGLDASSIISSLMSVERQPLQLMQTEQSKMKTELSSFGQLQSYMSALRDKSQAMTSLTLWGQTKAVSADASAVSVSTASGAAAGSYAIDVTALASAQTASSRAFAASTSTLDEGTLTIELGSWTGGTPATGFTAKAGAAPVSISIGPGETSLSAIRDKINGAGAGVTASIITDASGARLALRSKDTGAENAFRITASETVDDGDPTSGLSALGYSAATPSQMTRSQVAGNAQATINGIAISSASNTLSGVSDGMTINLLKATTTPVAVDVQPDKEAVKTAVNDFVKAFNDLAGFIKDQTKYDEATKKGGTLQGDRTVVGMQWQLRDILNQSTSASGTFGRLSDVGISMNADGKLDIASSKLDNGLANLPELKKLFATDGADTAGSGFMDRFKDYAALTLDNTEGAFATRNASLNSRIARNQSQQDDMNKRLTQTEARLTAQYQALDATMAKLNSLSSYVTQQMAMLNASA